MTTAALLVLADPLEPDGEQGRQWALAELADPVYRAAEPTAFDRLARAVADGVAAVLSGQAPAAWGPVLTAVAIAAVAAVAVTAAVVAGRPRLARRTAQETVLFGEPERRHAARLRRDAARAADAGDWRSAVVLSVRGLARDLAERGVVRTAPGTTVHAFARAAAAVFPAQAAPLHATAAVFDEVRYLDRPATAEGYALVRALDEELRSGAGAESTA